MDTGTLSIAFNFLLVTAFIIDRLFRIKSIKEYRDARDAEVAVLKERIDFIEKYNDGFISEKYRKAVEDLKVLVNDKDAAIEENLKHLSDLKLVHENEKEDFRNANNSFILQKTELEAANESLKVQQEVLTGQINRITIYLSHEIRKPIAAAMGLLQLSKLESIEDRKFVELMSEIIPEIESVIVKNINDLTPKTLSTTNNSHSIGP